MQDEINLDDRSIVEVTSQPLKEVIENIAEAWDTEVREHCSEYIVQIPESTGEGEIRGISFENGLGIIIYNGIFKKDIVFRFTLNEVHPVKYLYSVEDPIIHQFAEEEEKHMIKSKQCAVVASARNNGHVLVFEAGKKINLVSLEVYRNQFIAKLQCELQDISKELYAVLTDFKAERLFYSDGYYGIDFEYLLDSVNKFQENMVLRRMHLLSLALKIFVKQVQLFEDDLRSESDRAILRANEVLALQRVSDYIVKNLEAKLSIELLSKVAGLNANKLQMGFKFVHNMTVMEYVRRQRIIKASKLLANTDLPISDVSEKSGFESGSYFAKSFARIFGVSPKEYRTQMN